MPGSGRVPGAAGVITNGRLMPLAPIHRGFVDSLVNIIKDVCYLGSGASSCVQ